MPSDVTFDTTGMPATTVGTGTVGTAPMIKAMDLLVLMCCPDAAPNVFKAATKDVMAGCERSAM
jgi:D-arabinose 5-phosphate isomerase GutQ